ncbi:MAG: replication-associated recombination protein A [Desulfobacteraceae bacterium]|nr:MAG: replication-associated recombination protein A [Desulfobacteraceae bacterium]
MTIPLSERMRPAGFEEMVGQQHLIGPGSSLRKAYQSGHPFSLILWGPPGTGKTTLAGVLANEAGYPFRSFSAVTSGVKDLREVVAEAEKTFKVTGKPTILFVDEIHRFNKAQQDGFLPYVERGVIVLVGATTQNPSFEIIPPLLSRARVLILHPLEKEELRKILERAISDPEAGLGSLHVQAESAALDYLVDLSGGDARVALNNLEVAAYHVLEKNDPPLVDIAAVQEALTRKALPYDRAGEEHYNLISAFHKSLRGSDAQASLYWLYRMIVAGEDPLFICRRMIRFASEDIGMADPQALVQTLAAFDAWERVGPPEAELALAQAAVYLASAPKSNALYMAEKGVKGEIETSGGLPVPLHIRNAPTRLMKQLGYSKGYLYPHNYPDGWVDQEYLPDKIRERAFYKPTDRGFERSVRQKMAELERKKKARKSTRPR